MNPHLVAHRLNVRQSAALAGCCPDTIRRALAAGDIHGHQRASRGRWLIRPECLDAWLDGVRCRHGAGRA